jgi:hypothetical protein
LPEATHRVSFLAEANLSEVESSDFNPRASSGDAFTVVWNLSNAFTSAFKNWIPFHNSKPLQSWESSWRVAFRSRSELVSVPLAAGYSFQSSTSPSHSIALR